jgi:hypothetical protein
MFANRLELPVTEARVCIYMYRFREMAHFHGASPFIKGAPKTTWRLRYSGDRNTLPLLTNSKQFKRKLEAV